VALGTWTLERCPNPRFPYRIRIEAPDGRELLRLRAQDRWPAAGHNVFCLREDPSVGPAEAGEELERVAVLAMQRRGVRVSVVLDRGRYKRCDFLFLRRPYKEQPDQTYERVFWQTQTSMSQRRPKVAPAALRAGGAAMHVVIDSGERYPWRFPGSMTERARLPAGDYALVRDGKVLAVVERKTFANLLADFGVLPLLHQRLLELSANRFNALVVEAAYEDFLNPRRTHHFTPSFCAAAIAELYAAHPSLRVVFCANRKTANAWTASFFRAVLNQPSGVEFRDPKAP